jgi:hypothetical protein
MATLLIRCSLHAGLPEDEFRDWVRGRGRELVLEPAIADVEAAPLDAATWVVGLEVSSPAPESDDAVTGLIGDLRLLGLEPVVFRPDRVAPVSR